MKALIVNPFGIGDVLFTTPLARALHNAGYSVYYWSNERVADILRYNPSVEGVFALSRGDLRKAFARSFSGGVEKIIALGRWIKKWRFDVALDFSMDYRYSFILWLLGVKRRIGFDYKGRGRFLTGAISLDGFSGRHIAEHYAGLLKLIDGSLKADARMELFTGEGDDRWADGFLAENGISKQHVLIGVAPGGGASWGKDAFRKHWPGKNFASVADKAAAELGCKVLIFGSEEEARACESVAKNMNAAAVNTCGRLSIGRFAALLRRCRLLVANDGGPLHMASALGLKTVSIFGPVDEKVYGPYPPSHEHLVITGAAGCRPCYKNFRYPLCENTACMDSVDAPRVLEAVDKLLRQA